MREKTNQFLAYMKADPKRIHHALLAGSALLFVIAYTGFQVSHQPASKADSNIVYVPTSGAGAIPDTCNQPTGQAIPDESSALATFINSQTPGSVIEFPTDACYLVQEPLRITGTSSITINGNGATLERTDQSINALGTIKPVVFLYSNTGLTMQNININGGYNNVNYDGAAFEGNYGILLEADTNVIINATNVSNVGGDGINIQFDTGKGTSLNQNILVTNSNFTNMGYHGITLEAVNGVTFANDTFTDVSVDSMDYEYDDYSTVFANNQPTVAAEDNVNIINNNWVHNAYDWFASLQGQYPGVQEQNLVLSGNVISDSTQPFMQLGGTDEVNPGATETNSKYWFQNIYIQNNSYASGSYAKPTNGGTPGKQWVDNIGGMKNLGNVVIANNSIQVETAEGHGTPYLGVFRTTYPNGLSIKNNSFPGAYGLINPTQSSGITDANGNSLIDECGNSVGNPAAVADGTCTNPPCAPGLVGAPPNCKQPTPSIPSSLTANAASPTTVNLNWHASTPESGDQIGGYYIYRSSSTSQQQVVGQVGGTTTTFTDTSAAPGQTYSYIVESYDNQQPISISQASAAANVATPNGSGTAPSTPNLISATVVNEGEIDLSWSPSTDNSGPGVGGYYILRNGQVIASTSNTTFQDLTTQPLTAYSYTIEAYDTSTPSFTSGQSNSISQTTPINPGVPQKFNVSSTDPHTVNLSWNASQDKNGPGVGGYYIYRNGATTPTYTITDCTTSPCSYDDTTNISPNTTYTYTMASYDISTPVNISNQTAPASVVTPTGVNYPSPNAPTITSVANQTNGNVKINWSAPSPVSGGDGVAGYYVFRTLNGVTTQIATTTKLVYGDSTVQPSSTYSYYVEAYDNNVPPDVSGQSIVQSVTTLTPPTQAPTRPQGLTLSVISDSEIDLSWNGSSDVGSGHKVAGYYIYQDGVQIGSVTTSVLSYQVTNLNPSTTYSFTVLAFDNSTPTPVLSAPQSPAPSATTQDPPTGQPAIPTTPQNVQASDIDSQSANISWSASSESGGTIAGYYIYRGTDQIAQTNQTSYTDTGLTAGKTYSYTIIAFDTQGNQSNVSDPASVDIPANSNPSTPTTPANFRVSGNSFNTVTLSWDASTTSGSNQVAGYIIYCNGQVIADTGNTTFIQTALTPDTGYVYSIIAYDNSTPSLKSSSAEVSASTNAIGDIDDNGVVNGHDLSIFLGKYQTDYPPAEYDGNSLVEAHDLSMLLSNYAQ